MANAWMIRSDGKEFPMNVHIYGDIDDAEYTLEIAEWLYNATADNYTKDLIRSLVGTYAHDLDPDAVPGELEGIVNYQIKHGLLDLSPEFVKKLDLEHARLCTDIGSVNIAVNDALNQEFLRARYGGMYDSDSSNGEMYFRISSTGFNWFPIIWDFVYGRRNMISDVTVVKDPESTGMKNMYLVHDGSKIDHMPTDEFINLSGRPMFDSYHSLIDRFPDMNMRRRHAKIMNQHARDHAFLKGTEFSRRDEK